MFETSERHNLGIICVFRDKASNRKCELVETRTCTRYLHDGNACGDVISVCLSASFIFETIQLI